MKKFTKLLHVMTLLLLMSSVAFAQVVITPKAMQDQKKTELQKDAVQIQEKVQKERQLPPVKEDVVNQNAQNFNLTPFELQEAKDAPQKGKKEEVPTVLFSDPVFVDGMECPVGTVFGYDALGFGSAANSDIDGGYKIFNYFSGMGTPIATVHWWGINAYFDGVAWGGCTENPRDYEVEIWSDNAGLPGIQQSPTYAATITGVGTGVFFAGTYEIYEYTLTLPTPFTQSSGWVSIFGNPGGSPTCWFLWVNTGTAGTSAQQYNIAAGTYAATGYPMSMCLIGTASAVNDVAVTAINTPASGPAGVQSVNITVTNFGSASQSNIPVEYTYNAMTYTGTVPGPIGFLETANYTFTQTINPPVGANTITACTDLLADENAANDCFTKNFNITPAFDCDWTIELYDSWGDGWNGGTLDVVVDGYLLLDGITLATGFGPAIFSFGVNTGSVVQTFFTAGGWPEECSYEIYDSYGVFVASSGPVTGGPPNLTLTGDCTVPACLSPTNPTTTNITTTSARANWVVGGGELLWDLEYGPAGFTPGTGTLETGITNLNPFGNPFFDITALTPGGTYSWYVRADCGADVSNWVGPTTFTLLCEVICPVGALLENEPDIPDGGSDVTNGGCNSVPPVFTPIQPGDVYCGKVNTYITATGGNSRDTDWYRFDGTGLGTGVWEFTWTAEAEFPVLIFMIKSNGDDCDNLTLIGNTTANPCQTATLTFNNLSPDIYYFFIAPSVFTGYPASTGPHEYVVELTGNFTSLVAPVNDLCQDAIPIDCTTGTISGTTIGATFDGAPFCGTSNTAPGVWYLFTTTQLSLVEMNLCNTFPTWDTKLTVYSGDCLSLACVTGNDDYPCPASGALSGVNFTALPGVDYYVLVHGFSTATGDFDLDINCTPLYLVEGTLSYGGPGSIPIDNSLVEVYDNTDPLLPVLLGTVPTDDFGDYIFYALPDDYALYGSTLKPRGGTNLADINLVIDHLLGIPLTGLPFLAADVNDDGFVTLGDYNLLVDELLGSNPAWAAPDWVFENPAFTLSGDLVVDFQALCSGDPDGSYAVPFGSFAPLGATCADAYPVAAIPFNMTGMTTCGFGNNYSSADACGSSYMNGEDFVFEFTPAANMFVDITLTNTDTWVGLFVTEGCPDVGTCVDFATNSAGNPALSTVALTGGVTYYIIVSTWPSPFCTPFDISIVEVAPPSGYCDAFTSFEWEYISGVLCGSINNQGTLWQGGVADYTAQSTTIAAGGSETIVVTVANYDAPEFVTVWVDWNDDFVFGVGTDEEFIIPYDGNNLTHTGTITVPAGTTPGTKRMRVRLVWNAAPQPCGTADYGEVEDYSIVVP